jgi:N-acetylglucosaminyldiphosphoundecaprenol N-acetyl-beta-D-mannosaminyltransferase
VLNNLNVAIVGGTSHESRIASQKILNIFPDLKLVYHSDGYSEFNDICNELTKFKVNLLISGMGTPLQEDFLIFAKKYVPSLKLGFTCGGFVSQTAYKTFYYSPLIDAFNLRWFQRFILHGYVRKRLLIDYPRFYFSFIIRHLTKKIFN